MNRPDWYYDDLEQVGTDFADQAQVATHDARQSDDADKDRIHPTAQVEAFGDKDLLQDSFGANPHRRSNHFAGKRAE